MVAAMRLTGMPTQGDKLGRLGIYPWKQTFGLLLEGETIQRVVLGQDSDGKRNVVLAATELRVVRISHPGPISIRALTGNAALYYEDVLDVGFTDGRFIPRGTLTVTGRVEVLQVDKCPNAMLRPMKAFVEQKMREARLGHGQITQVVLQNPTPTTDLATQIQHLADLLQQGVLTEPEFRAAKRKLLG